MCDHPHYCSEITIMSSPKRVKLEDVNDDQLLLLQPLQELFVFHLPYELIIKEILPRNPVVFIRTSKYNTILAQEIFADRICKMSIGKFRAIHPFGPLYLAIHRMAQCLPNVPNYRFCNLLITHSASNNLKYHFYTVEHLGQFGIEYLMDSIDKMHIECIPQAAHVMLNTLKRVSLITPNSCVTSRNSEEEVDAESSDDESFEMGEYMKQTDAKVIKKNLQSLVIEHASRLFVCIIGRLDCVNKNHATIFGTINRALNEFGVVYKPSMSRGMRLPQVKKTYLNDDYTISTVALDIASQIDDILRSALERYKRDPALQWLIDFKEKCIRELESNYKPKLKDDLCAPTTLPYA